jgi:uncharacterized membrane protein YeaQ/YmgE (transglycosylase-associated protein family)
MAFPAGPAGPKERLEERRAIQLYQGKDSIMTLAALILADVNLSLTNVLWWLIVGLVAGFLASRVMSGGGYGLIGDIVVGIIGAILGGWLAGLLGLGSFGLIGTIVVAFIGACILIAILHAVSGGGSRRSRRWGRR